MLPPLIGVLRNAVSLFGQLKRTELHTPMEGFTLGTDSITVKPAEGPVSVLVTPVMVALSGASTEKRSIPVGATTSYRTLRVRLLIENASFGPMTGERAINGPIN
jgi:hypothetical protein